MPTEDIDKLVRKQMIKDFWMQLNEKGQQEKVTKEDESKFWEAGDRRGELDKKVGRVT